MIPCAIDRGVTKERLVWASVVNMNHVNQRLNCWKVFARTRLRCCRSSIHSRCDRCAAQYADCPAGGGDGTDGEQQHHHRCAWRCRLASWSALGWSQRKSLTAWSVPCMRKMRHSRSSPFGRFLAPETYAKWPMARVALWCWSNCSPSECGRGLILVGC